MMVGLLPKTGRKFPRWRKLPSPGGLGVCGRGLQKIFCPGWQAEARMPLGHRAEELRHSEPLHHHSAPFCKSCRRKRTMATAGRCLHRFLFAAGSVPSRLRTALPVFSAAAPAAFAPTGASFLEPDSPARQHSADSNLRATSFSIIDHGSRAIHSAPLHNNEALHRNSASRLGLQLLAGLEIHNIKSISSFSTKASPPNDINTAVIEKPKTLDDFRHEEIVGPTVERDESPVADELRDALRTLQKRMLSFQKSLVVLGGLQGAGAVWCYVSWHALDPTWQLVPSALMSLMLAFVLRAALQPISFFGKLEERSRLRIITLSLMIAKGFSSFFNRARILVAASALGLLFALLYNPSTYLLGLLGILK